CNRAAGTLLEPRQPVNRSGGIGGWTAGRPKPMEELLAQFAPVKYAEHHDAWAVEAILKHIRSPENLQHDLAIFFTPQDGPSKSRMIRQDLRLGHDLSCNRRRQRWMLPGEKFPQNDRGRRAPRPTIRPSSATPAPKSGCAPSLKPPDDVFTRRNRILRLEGLPTAIQFGDLVVVGRNRAGRKGRQLCCQLGNGDTLLVRALLERCRGVAVDFNRLGFHRFLYSASVVRIQRAL